MLEQQIIFFQEDTYAVIKLNRPRKLNAINNQTMDEICEYLETLDKNNNIKSVIITGGDKIFAAGADLEMINEYDYTSALLDGFITKNWDPITKFRKPIIAVVNGYCLGGGCELALACDIILASETARFAQPEIKVGFMPGAGGTQRIAVNCGKYQAMDLCLTAKMIDANEAYNIGMISRISNSKTIMDNAISIATSLGEMPLSSLMCIKEAINNAFEVPLTAGIRAERNSMYGIFGTNNYKRGIAAHYKKEKHTFDI